MEPEWNEDPIRCQAFVLAVLNLRTLLAESWFMDRLHVNPVHTASLGFILTFPSHLHLGRPNSFFPLGFQTTILCEFLIFLCPTLIT
jgi:hypothetical protein